MGSKTALVCVVIWLAGFANCKSSEPETVPVEDTEAVCYDDFDNDDNGATDCADEGCAGFASCCVGRGLEACCEARDREFFQSWASCPGTFETCAPEMTLVGSPLPLLVQGGIAADDSATFPSGAYITEPFDPGGSNLRVVASMALPVCSGDCVSVVAFGLSPTPFFIGQFPSYSFSFSILIFARVDGFERGLIFRRDRVIGEFSVPDNEFHNYAIEANASGSVTFLEVDDAGDTMRVLLDEFPIDRLELPDPSYAVVTGQQVEATGQDLPGRVRSLYVDRGVCDMPQRAFSASEPVTHPDDISVASIDGLGRAENAAGLEALVLETPAGLHFAEGDGADGYRLVGSAASPELTASMLPGVGAERISDPWLLADEASRTWTMYFTVWFNPGSSSIASISSTANFGSGFDLSSFAIVAEADFSFPVITDATVAGDRMVVRLANSDSRGGFGLLASLRREADGRFATTGPTLGASVIVRPTLRTGDFDSANVSAPALIELGGILRLYYTGLRGTRETIGVVLSDTGEGWRRPHGDDALWPLHPGGFDILGASDPAPIVRDGQVELLYVGFDGARSSIGRATSGSPFTWPSVNPFP